MEIICPKCQTSYKNVAVKFSHKSVRCKKCQHRFTAIDSSSPQETQLYPPELIPDPTSYSKSDPTSYSKSDPIPEGTIDPQETRLAAMTHESQTESTKSLSDHLRGDKAKRESTLSVLLNLGSEQFFDEKKLLSGGATDWQAGDVLLDRYEIKRLLGEGQFGQVFQVRHRDWGLDLALKTPKQKALSAGFESIEKEAETWVNLDLHPNIVNCYYVRRIDGIPQIFSEYVDGGDLKNLLNSGRLYKTDPDNTLLSILDIAIQFAWGLEYAHQQGLIHQDIKPANVMISSEGIVKITDFGLAKAGAMLVNNKQSLVVAGMGMTPAYASPEQLAGKPLTWRTDLWSWGVCVLEMMLGYCSWEAGSIAPAILDAYKKKQLDENPALASIPDALYDLLMACFNEDESKRPDSLHVVADTLVQIYNTLSEKKYNKIQPQGGIGTASSLNNQAISLLDLGQKNEAVDAWNNALSIEPGHFESLFNFLFYQWKYEGLEEQDYLQKIEMLLENRHKSNISKSDLPRNKAQQKARIKFALASLYLHFSSFKKILSLYLTEKNPLQSLADLSYENEKKIVGLALCEQYRLDKNAPHWQLIANCLKDVIASNASDPYTNTAYTLALQRSGQTRLANKFFKASSAMGIIPRQLKQAVALFLPGYEVLYRIAKKSISFSQFVNNDENIVLNQGSRLFLWSIKAKKTLREMCGHIGKITAFCISSDEKLLLTGSDQGDVRIWSMQTSELLHVWSAHDEAINALQISACGQYVWTTCNDSLLYLWQVDKKQRLNSFYGEGHSGEIMAIHLSPFVGSSASAIEDTLVPNGLIASASADNIIRIWELVTGRTLILLSGHSMPVGAVQWLDETHVLSASYDKTIRLWDISSGQCQKVYKGHQGIVNTLKAATEGHFFLSGSSDGDLRYWDIKTASSFTLTQFNSAISHISLDHSNHFASVVTLSGVHIVETNNIYRYHATYLFSLPESAMEIDQLSRLFEQSISQAKAALDKNKIAAIAHVENARAIQGYERDYSAFKFWAGFYLYFPRIKLKDVWKYNELKAHQARVLALELSPSNHFLYSLGQDQCLYQWDIQSQKKKRILEQHQQAINLIKVSDDGAAILLACGKNIFLKDIKTAKQLSLFSHHNADVLAMTLTAEGRFCLSCDDQGKFYLWRLLTGEMMANLSDKSHHVAVVNITQDGRFILTGQRNNNHIALWDIATGKVVDQFSEHDNIVTSIASTTDGLYFVSASADSSLRLWKTQSSRTKSLRVMKGHSQRINQVCIDGQGKIALSVSDDKSLRIWSLASGECLYDFERIDTKDTSINISLDGQFAFSGDAQGSIMFWCLDWFLKKNIQLEWNHDADIYLQNYFSTHSSKEPVKELNNIRRLLKYAGFGAMNDNEINMQLLHFSQININTLLPGSRLNSPKTTLKQGVNKKPIRSNKLTYVMLFFIVFLGLIFVTIDQPIEEPQRETLTLNVSEQNTINNMMDLIIPLARLNEAATFVNGRLDRSTLLVPLNMKNFRQRFQLGENTLVDDWNNKYIYKGTITGPFRGRMILRSAGRDQQLNTEDDLLLTGFPHWRYLEVKRNNVSLLKLSEIKVRYDIESNLKEVLPENDRDHVIEENNDDAELINNGLDSEKNEQLETIDEGIEVMIPPEDKRPVLVE
ncbi:protein kinase domain-containing protein [sulfur-oxidizing endosymbiont of Gigantopelta aegis]|uniref:protein kinase domain-containing protein n=1 Tax=sulfur-oxidizing endosymbiont of Gigantopelta aegis TaxID=2794934 RepID=UPI0018DDCD50|nr:protein kinase [sulfur-oxidizing endosymbiont of Gigantopelta aegis]